VLWIKRGGGIIFGGIRDEGRLREGRRGQTGAPTMRRSRTWKLQRGAGGGWHYSVIHAVVFRSLEKKQGGKAASGNVFSKTNCTLLGHRLHRETL